jgi:hypothetical protein
MARKPRNYKKEYREYQGKPEQIKRRAKRNAARAMLHHLGVVRKGDGKDVHHKKGLVNVRGNLRVMSKHRNRSIK